MTTFDIYNNSVEDVTIFDQNQIFDAFLIGPVGAEDLYRTPVDTIVN
jgi:hypothetical protein